MTTSDSDRSVRKAALIMFAYAALLIGGGVWAFIMAPAGASAITALLIPGICALVMIACGVASMLIRKHYMPGMIGIHIGIILPLVFSIAFMSRGVGAYRASGVYRYAALKYVEHRKESGETFSADAMKAYFKELNVEGSVDLGLKAVKVPDHDKTYLGHTLTALSGISIASFAALVLSRPKVPKAPPKQKPAAEPEAKKAGSPFGEPDKND